ncbi:MAG TPA: hypothetical protein VGL44_06325, partial [Gaiellales bacterium]
VAVTVILFTGGASVDNTPAAADAATVLDQAAARTLLHGLRGEIPAAKFWYQRYVIRTRGQAQASSEKWLSRTGSGRWRLTGRAAIDARFPTASWAGATTHSHIHFLNRGPWQAYSLTGRQLSYRQMLRLTTSPRALLRVLAPKAGTPRLFRNLTAFENVAGMLVQPALPAPLRAGLFRALALVGGARVLGRTTVAGQPAVIIGQLTAGMLTEMLVNPKDGVWLEGRTLVHGKVVSDVRLVASGLVDSTSQTRISSGG